MDHQLLVSIFGPKTGVPPLSAARMQSWCLILVVYQYEIEYPRSAEHANADALSRLVSSSADDRLDVDEYLISYVDELPITARDIASARRKDLVLARVYDSTLHGWHSVVADPVLQPYFSRKHELSVGQGCVLLGLRVVIAFACWMTCIKNIMSSVGRSLWQQVIFGGPDWIWPSESVLGRVMFVR